MLPSAPSQQADHAAETKPDGETMKNLRITCLLLTLAWASNAAAFYNATPGRWLSRDPLGESGFELRRLRKPHFVGDSPQLYSFVRNSPAGSVDRLGLSLWVCTNPAFSLIPGSRHAYLWRDDPDWGGNRQCAMQSVLSSGGTVSAADQGPPPGSGDEADQWDSPSDGIRCRRVPDSANREDGPFGCCRSIANAGVWTPWLWDCHSPVSRCLRNFGLTDPGHPRFD